MASARRTGASPPDRMAGRPAAVESGEATMAASGSRVLLVAPQPFYEDRGTPIAVDNVLRALSQLNYQVDVVTYPVGRAVDIPGVRIIRAANPFGIRRVPIGFSIRKLLLDTTLIYATWAQLRRERYVCIHAVEEAAFWAAWLRERCRVPVIYDMQSSLPEQLVNRMAFRDARVQRFLRACERWLLRHVDAVVSSAGLLQRVAVEAPGTIAREWHFPTAPALPAPGAADGLRRELGIPTDARIVMYTGTFEPYQGLSLLLQAIPRVVQAVPGTVFVLVGGEGDGAVAVRTEAEQRGINGALRILGRQPRQHIPAYLALADVLVSPRSYGDNLPLKVFDYMAAGRPIVATDVPAHRAVLNERLARLAAPSGDALASAIVELLLQPGPAAELAEAGRAYAARHFGWYRFVHGVGAVYGAVARPADVRVHA
ncbi:MAG TPA: glycosyltransferase family 4 protein [Gemmatimonadales bacterium]|nr:glycosyltransferase family 4 protein [Gemmatimonadales bacterium]